MQVFSRMMTTKSRFQTLEPDRSHAPRGNASRDAPRHTIPPSYTWRNTFL